MKLKLNYWVAAEDIINTCLFAISWFLIIGASFSDSFDKTSSLSGVSLFLTFISCFGLLLHLIQLQQCRRWHVSLVGPILGIIGNGLFLIAPLFALPAIIILIIAAVFEFINKVKKVSSQPAAKVWYRTWWVLILTVLIVIYFIFASVSASQEQAARDQQNRNTPNLTKEAQKNTDKNPKLQKNNSDLIHIKNNVIVTPKGKIEILKEASGKTTDGKMGVIFMYKITNTSNQALTPKQILADNQINVYEKDSNSEKPAQQTFGTSDFTSMQDFNDANSAIDDAINNDYNNWDKTEIGPHQSVTMSDGQIWKLDDGKTPIIKIGDSINNVDSTKINPHQNQYQLDNSVEKIEITKWNG
ncbi:DUF5067 domain-containing protein [Fructilactobacillus myrtifloralis]|uniref:DUF5067 domain-containing protein n=1 Tax=Fructilactobacillus myrtifloralis TaxID=2940301 RepID=A0ABY5BR97_9LACO|nr:DUF5067 domain-containing protein [Fructilactobacillus myrtifloralis]USS85583.1 DUF5067 domain-containing protein [Fructilactobacillus myrtifloralis]